MAQMSNTPTKAAASKTANQKTSFLKDDFPTIRKPSLTLLICLAIASVLIVGSRFFLYQQEEKRQQAQAELAQAHEQYSAATTEKNNIIEYRDQYLHLVELGFVGEEKRLDLIELIRSTQEKSRLLPISYSLSPQKTVEIDPSILTSELTLNASKLVLQSDILHELDLFTLLNSLQEKFTLSPQSCSIKKNDKQFESVLSPNLEMECSVYLLTMQRKVVATEVDPSGAIQ